MDPLAKFAAAVVLIAPEIEAGVRQIERGLRDDLGGQRVYIAAAPSEAKAHAIGAALVRGEPLRAAAAKAGCTLRHAARLATRARK